jgi:drug/metabolite transporter (DMT)-like permease
MAVLLALVAALLFAAGTVLQQKVAAQASGDEAVSAGFLVRLAREPLWLAGIAVDGLGFVCQALALKVGQLAVVQPLLAATIVFALPMGAALTGKRIGRRELIGALAVTGGLALFLFTSDPSGGRDGAPLGEWLLAAAVLGPLSAVLFLVGTRSQGRRRATFFGLAAGVLFGVTAALTKSTVDDLSQGVPDVLLSWHLYALAAIGYASMSLSSASLQTGELAPAIATAMALDPLTSLVLGVTLFEETLRSGGFAVVATVIGLGVMVGGIALLAADERTDERDGGRTRRRPSVRSPGRPATAATSARGG